LESLLLQQAEQLERYVRRKLPKDVQRVVAPEDVLQEVWTTALRRASAFRATRPDDFERWLMKITESRVIDVLRYARRLKRKGGNQLEYDGHRRPKSYLDLFARVASDEPTPSSEDEAKEAVRAVQLAVAGLPDDCRSAITLHHLHGHTRQQIAGAMGKTEAAVNSLLYRGLQNLRTRFKRMHGFLSGEIVVAGAQGGNGRSRRAAPLATVSDRGAR
jgi:RNA polymerase sigma-70 factor (ECF subfamily)